MVVPSREFVVVLMFSDGTSLMSDHSLAGGLLHRVAQLPSTQDARIGDAVSTAPQLRSA